MVMLMEKSFDTSPFSKVRGIYRIIRDETGESDPYREIKMKDNRDMMDILPYFKEVIKIHGRPAAPGM